MISMAKAKYKTFEQSRNILVDHDEILMYYPDYYKTKVELEKEKFISYDKAKRIFMKNYKSSPLYLKLTELAMNEMEIYQIMVENRDVKYAAFQKTFEASVNESKKLCDLIDYVGHYPATWPVPEEEEKNPEMEELLEEYDIMVRYYLNDDIDKMQITSDDVVRIIDTLERHLAFIRDLKELTSTNDWLVTRKKSPEEIIDIMETALEQIHSFPLSNYQEKGNSKREEGKMYLRRQHGKNII